MNEELKNGDYMLLEQVAYEHGGQKKFADFFSQTDYDNHRSIIKSLKEQKLVFPVIFRAGWMEKTGRSLYFIRHGEREHYGTRFEGSNDNIPLTSHARNVQLPALAQRSHNFHETKS